MVFFGTMFLIQKGFIFWTWNFLAFKNLLIIGLFKKSVNNIFVLGTWYVLPSPLGKYWKLCVLLLCHYQRKISGWCNFIFYFLFSIAQIKSGKSGYIYSNTQRKKKANLFVIVKKWFWCTNILLIGQPKKNCSKFFSHL